MSYPLPPVAISASGTAVVPLGSVSGVGSVVIANESPYGAMASVGGSGRWIPAQFADRMDCNTGAFDGTLTLTTNDYLTNAASAPSFIVLITVYPPGEPVPGTYPVALSRVANVGNTVMANSATDTFEQDLFTPFILSGLVPSKDGINANQVDVTAGVAFLRQADSSLLRQAPASATYRTSVPNTTYYLDMNPDASFSWTTAHSTQSNYLSICTVTTDASGNIINVISQRITSTTLLASAAGQINIGLLAATSFLTLTPASTLVIEGAWNAVAPVTLAAGNQETGACGMSFIATGAGQMVYYVVNFKTVMTNTPTSVNLSYVSGGGYSSVAADGITKSGFRFKITSTAAGAVDFTGTYTTVGN